MRLHPTVPQSILLIKSHSMGIGDLLRSSAAWRALKQKWPQVKLHLLMLSKHAGYASESLITSHHLLTSASFVTVKTGAPGATQHSLPFADIVRAIEEKLGQTSIDMVIDCEPYGIKTSLLARKIAQRKKAVTVGIAQFPFRKYFYDKYSPSVTHYVASHNLVQPMDYTERDFVVLAALDIERQGTRIELEVDAQGLAWQEQNAIHFDSAAQQVVLNIGCGTLDALHRRPDLQALVDAMVTWHARRPFVLHLTGADFEKEVNDAFIQKYSHALSQLGLTAQCTNWAGQCTLHSLAGLIAKADVVVTSDSGPYHMAVALGIPTLCWFNFANPSAYHLHSDVILQIQPSKTEFADAAMRLLALSSAS